MKHIFIKALAILMLSMPAVSCSKVDENILIKGEYFTYKDVTYTPTIDKTGAPREPFFTNVFPLTNQLRNDFAYGYDISTTDLRKPSDEYTRYRDQIGNQRDPIEMLKEGGGNFARIRLWNDPKDEDGALYNDIVNDLETDIKLAKAAQRVGMNILLNIQYSDFHTNDQFQTMPKAWEKASNLNEKVYQFTLDSLKAFKNEGITIDAVQIGSEINNGLLWPYAKLDKSNYDESMNKITGIVKQGIKACKEVYEDCRIVIHNGDVKNKEEFIKFYKTFVDKGVDFDIVGASYYPIKDGTLDNLESALNEVSKKFNKAVMILETAYPTSELPESYRFDNLITYPECKDFGLMPDSQGQTTLINTLLDLLSRIQNQKGLGLFYFEPNAVIDFANEPGGEYLEDEDTLLSSMGPLLRRTTFYAEHEIAYDTINAYKKIKENPVRLNSRYERQVNSLTLTLGQDFPKTFEGEDNYGYIKDYEYEFASEPELHRIEDVNFVDVYLKDQTKKQIRYRYTKSINKNYDFNYGNDDWDLNNCKIKLSYRDKWQHALDLGSDFYNHEFKATQKVDLKPGYYELFIDVYLFRWMKMDKDNYLKVKFDADGDGITDDFMNNKTQSEDTTYKCIDIKVNKACEAELSIYGNLPKSTLLQICKICVSFTRPLE